MRVLLDTSFSDERRFFAEQSAELFVSAVTIWEMRLKYRARHPSGKRKSRFNPYAVVAMVERQDVTPLPMTMQHATRELEVPIPHKDPFDELLLVQAQEEGLRFLTADRQLIGHPLAITA